MEGAMREVRDKIWDEETRKITMFTDIAHKNYQVDENRQLLGNKVLEWQPQTRQRSVGNPPSDISMTFWRLREIFGWIGSTAFVGHSLGGSMFRTYLRIERWDHYH